MRGGEEGERRDRRGGRGEERGREKEGERREWEGGRGGEERQKREEKAQGGSHITFRICMS